MKIAINIFLAISGVYLIIGLLFGIFFLFKVPKIDPLMADINKENTLYIIS